MPEKKVRAQVARAIGDVQTGHVGSDSIGELGIC